MATIMAAGRSQEVIDVEYNMQLPAVTSPSGQSLVAYLPSAPSVSVSVSVDTRSWFTGQPMAAAAAFARHGAPAGMTSSAATSARDAFLRNAAVASNRVKHPLPRDPWHG